MDLIRRRSIGALLLYFALVVNTMPALAAAPQRPPDHVVPGWYLGMPVIAMAWDTLSMEDRLARRLPEGVVTMDVYITAPVSATAATSPQRMIPLPSGPRMLPSHQTTLPRLNSPDEPLVSIGWFVIPGAKAQDDNLRTDPRPENGWASQALAREIRIGTEWLPLNSHVIINYGLERGILALEYFDGGSLIWATLDWNEYTQPPELALSCDGGLMDAARFASPAEKETP